MLINFASMVKKIDNLSKPQKAKVVDNNDPLQLGRVKLTIAGIIEGDVANLPWSHPQNPIAFGGNPNSAHFAVPDIGTDLTVDFDQGHPYQLTHKGYSHSQNNYKMDPFKTNYPQAWGWVDPSNNTFVQDRKLGTWSYTHNANPDNQSAQSSGSGGVGQENTENPLSSAIPRWLTSSIDKLGNFITGHLGNFGLTTAKNHLTTVQQNKTVQITQNHTITTGGNSAITTSGTSSHVGAPIFLNC